MKKIIKIFQILKKSKFIFCKPEKKNILIYDKESLDPLSSFFNMDQVFVLDSRKETINFYIVFKMIINFNLKSFNYQNYLKKIISLVKPKLVITSIDNHIPFFELKSSFKDICFVSVQSTIHFVTGDILESLQKDKIFNKYNSDYYFVYSDSYGKEVSKFIKSNYITIGSVKNNFFNISSNYKKKTLGYISRTPNSGFEYIIHKDLDIIKKNYEEWEVKLLEFLLQLIKSLKNYCLSNSINFNIIGATTNSEIEFNFYKNLLGEKNWSFAPREGIYDSYKKIDNYEIIVNPMSTLGYEAIARQKKVAFFSMDHCIGASFGWPELKEKRGDFFSNSCEVSEIHRILNYLFGLSDEEWRRSIKQYQKKLFFYDENNSKLKNFLKKY